MLFPSNCRIHGPGAIPVDRDRQFDRHIAPLRQIPGDPTTEPQPSPAKIVDR